MKSIFWTQNADINESNSVYIDGKSHDSYSKEDIDNAFDKISKYQLDEDFAFTNFQDVCKKYNLPRNFKFFVDVKRGSFLQATFNEKDDYGRPMPFMIWVDNADPRSLIKELRVYSQICGKTIEESSINNYLKAWKDLNRKPLAFGWLLVVLVITILILTIAILWKFQS